MFGRSRAVCLAVLLAAAQPGHAQSSSIDTTRTEPVSEQEYWAQIEHRDWHQAIQVAEQLVAAVRSRSEQSPEALSHALTLLGSAQLASRNYVAAEAAFAEALEVLERLVVPSHEKMLEPLRGLGYTLAHAGKHEQAVPFMERALLISRRTHGLFDINQQHLLRELATSLSKLGLYAQAEQHMQYLVRVGEQTYGAKDPRMAHIYDVVGDFYIEAGAITPARDAYRHALRLVESKLGRDDLATVQPLRSLAESYRRELYLSHYGIRAQTADQASNGKPINPRRLDTEGERALKRALKTLDKHPTRSTKQLFDTLLDLGDWYMIKGEQDAAMSYYRRATELLEQVEPEYADAARARLSFPVQVYYPIPSAATRNLTRPPEAVDERFVHAMFTVAADGTVRDAHIVDKNASDRHAEETLDALRQARYRPKFANGEPVETRDVSLRQVFKLRKDRSSK